MRELMHREFPWGSTTIVETDDICAYLADKYTRFPDGAKIYHEKHDVTPRDEAGVEHLQTLSGEFTINMTPGGATLAVLLVTTALSVGVGYLMRPDLPDEPTQARADAWNPGSGTNSTGRLPNRERLNARVPDIYGEVRHTLDLLAPVVRRYENSTEVEYAYLAIGRGYFSDTLFDLEDGDVAISSVDGYSAAVYSPGDRITQTPERTIGDDIPIDEIFSVCWRPVDGATFESLPPQNSTYMHYVPETPSGGSGLRPLPPSVQAASGHVFSAYGDDTYGYDDDYDLGIHYPAGSKVSIYNIRYSSGVPGSPPPLPDLYGTYLVLKATAQSLFLEIPSEKQAAWDSVSEDPNVGPYIELDMSQYVYNLEYETRAHSMVDVTFECPQGMYFSDTHRDVVQEVWVESTWEQRDFPGATMTRTSSEYIRAASRDRTGLTIRHVNPFPAAEFECDVTIKLRLTSAFKPGNPTNWAVNSQARVDLKSIMACYEPTQGSFETSPEVTTVLTRMVNTAATRALEQRGLTVTTARKTRTATSPTTYVDLPTCKRMESVLYEMTIDPRIGRLDDTVVPWDDWTSARGVVESNFDLDACDVGFVFDNANSTFEDMFAAVCKACFCYPYRIGKSLTMKPIIPQTTPVMLFNSRNKIPNTETLAVRFGFEDDHDGAIVPYRDSDSEKYERLEYQHPPGGYSNSVAPKQVPVEGLIYRKQAAWHARREFARIYWQNFQVTFQATEEAALLLPGDLIMVTDGTRFDVIEGDLVEVSGTTIYLSNYVKLREDAGDTTDFVIFFQQPDGTVIVRDIVGPDHLNVNQLTIDSALPASSTDDNNFARTTYYIVEDTTDAGYDDLFLVQSVEPVEKGIYEVKAFNYTGELYAGDDDPVV
jgi:hypothetical protein